MKTEAVALLRQMGDWMRAAGDFRRARAYRAAAREIAQRDDFEQLLEQGRLKDIPGVGDSIARTLTRYAKEGRRPEWLESAPPPVAEPEVPDSFHRAPFAGVPDLHVHTTWSDGSLDLDEVVDFAHKMGQAAVGVSDHSASLRVARGLTPEQVRAQWAEMDALQATRTDIRILKGTECDVLRDGALDHPDDLLAQFDYVIGSLHTHLKLPKAEQTARVLAALDSPHLTVLGHPTTRVPNRRPRAELDLDKVFEKASANGVAMEVNGNPGRLDLDADLARRALEAGCTLALTSDGHSAEEMLALETARRMASEAGATAEDVLNCRFVPRRRVSA